MAIEKILFLTILYVFVFMTTAYESDTGNNLLQRNKRQLLFPNSTVLQLNAGLATPSPAAMIFVNWAIQANFQLPWNRSQIPSDILETDTTYGGLSRRRREQEEGNGYENDARLYHFYKYVEGALDGFGHNGTTCVLRTLCQLGAEPIAADDKEDLLHELAGFALNPRNDADFPEYKTEIHPYIEAYEHGESLQNCTNLYQTCVISLLDLFSKPYTVS